MSDIISEVTVCRMQWAIKSYCTVPFSFVPSIQ